MEIILMSVEEQLKLQASVTSADWLMRLCHMPFMLDGSIISMCEKKQKNLSLVNYFKKRPVRDVWIYLVSRFSLFAHTTNNTNEIHGLLTSCELPLDMSRQYRDFSCVQRFSVQARMCASGRLPVTWTTLKRKPVVILDTTFYKKRQRVVILNANLPVEDVENTEEAGLSPENYATHVFPECDSNEWSETCWEMIYMVYRDFATCLIKTKRFPHLRVYSNLTNDRPSYDNLEDLLVRFKPFLLRDMKLRKKGISDRAVDLFYGMEAEYTVLRDFAIIGFKIYNRTNVDLLLQGISLIIKTNKNIFVD